MYAKKTSFFAQFLNEIDLGNLDSGLPHLLSLFVSHAICQNLHRANSPKET